MWRVWGSVLECGKGEGDVGRGIWEVWGKVWGDVGGVKKCGGRCRRLWGSVFRCGRGEGRCRKWCGKVKGEVRGENGGVRESVKKFRVLQPCFSCYFS